MLKLFAFTSKKDQNSEFQNKKNVSSFWTESFFNRDLKLKKYVTNLLANFIEKTTRFVTKVNFLLIKV